MITYNFIEKRNDYFLLRYNIDKQHNESVMNTLYFAGFMKVFLGCCLKYLVLNTIIFITNVDKCN